MSLALTEWATSGLHESVPRRRLSGHHIILTRREQVMSWWMDVRRGGYSYLAVKDGARERPLQWAVNNVDGLAQIATFAMELARSKVVPRDVLVYGCLCTWGMVLSDD